MEKLPKDFLENMRKILNEEDYQNYLDSLFLPVEKAIRVNTNKINVAEFKKVCNFNLESVPYWKDAFYVSSEQKLGNNFLHLAGAFYIQEPSSLIPIASVSHLNFIGKKVLDLCASPGGKTGQLAELVKENGLVVANEYVYSRSKILQENIDRMGYKNVVVTCDSAEHIAKDLESTFDLVLVDAPCSGEGMFKKDIEATKYWSNQGIISNGVRQFEILKNGAKSLKKGGILVYSTCTFNPIENEQVVLKLLDEGEFETVKLNPVVQPFVSKGLLGLTNAGRFYPFKNRGEGQFVAVLKKIGEEKLNNEKFVFKKISSSTAINFLSNNLNEKDIYNFEEINGIVNIVPKNCVAMGKINVLSKGVRLGEVNNLRLEPSHQFFSAFGIQMKNKLNLNLSDELLIKYVRGEELKTNNILNGYGAVLLHGCAIGGFKAVNGTLKNRFPKSLRIR